MKYISSCVLVYLVLLPLHISAQEGYEMPTQHRREAKNAIHLTAGTFLPLAIHLSFHAAYERKLPLFQDKPRINLWARADAGYTLNWTDELTEAGIRPVLLFGSGKSLLEFAVGIHLLTESHSPGVMIFPGANLGYRSQSADGGFIFRTGLGITEGAYLSFGWCF